MTHERTTIRNTIVTLLDTGAIVASGKVYSNRSLPVAESQLPVLLVYTQSETSAPTDLSGDTLTRALTFVVEGVVRNVNDATIDDTLDTLADGVEDALQGISTASFGDTTLVATDVDTERGGEAPLGRIRLTFTARYHY